MHRPTMWSVLALLTACKASISGAPEDQALVDAAAGDTPAIDAPVGAPIDAVMLGAWSTPAKIPQASSATLAEDDVTLSSNTLEMIFAINGTNGKDLYYSSRTSTTSPWAAAVALPFNSSTTSDETPRLSADDKTLYFASGRAGNNTLDIYTVTRPAAGSTAWGVPQPFTSTSVNTTNFDEKWLMPCGTHYIMVQSTTNNGTDLFEGVLGSTTPPTPITALNSPQNETGTFLSQDCLTIYFASARTTPTMIYTSHRTAVGAAWSTPTAVTDFKITGGNGNQEDPWMSADGRTFVFASDAAGTKDVYISTR